MPKIRHTADFTVSPACMPIVCVYVCACVLSCTEEVIRGWEIGIASMARGEIALLHCAPSYAYHETGLSPAVPPNATLLFEVEMLDFKG